MSTDADLGAIEALAAEGAWKEALARGRLLMRQGVAADRVLTGLARGAIASGRLDRAAKALEQAPDPFHVDVVALRFDLQAAERGAEAAREWVRGLAAERPGDEALAALVARIGAPPRDVVGVLPLERLSRVERLMAAGFAGPALRLARRLRIAHPDDEAVLDAALRALEALGALPDDVVDVCARGPSPELDEVVLDLEPLDMGPL